jgi:murein DD-endopeptidase MepM/ murein hydrolase activator NlpD
MPHHPQSRTLSGLLGTWASPIALQIRDFYRDCVEDIPLLTRIASHIGLLALVVLTIGASGVRLEEAREQSEPAVGESEFSPETIEVPGDLGVPVEQVPDEAEESTGGGFLSISPLPLTDIPKRIRREVLKYTVESGDTVSDIAQEYGVSPDSILWANPKLEDNPDMLSLGQVLNIPPTTGVLYTVQSGDTVQKIANLLKGKKKVDDVVDAILSLEFNKERHRLEPPNYGLIAGQFLMVPGGIKPYVAKSVVSYSGPVPSRATRGTGRFGWPVSGRITQKYWTRHPGIDIAAPKGTPIFAADAGYVTFAGWDRERVSYGNMILINHGNGYVTRYAHLSAFVVTAGDSVKKGQLIGRVGSTGNSTGPHLHFEIIRNGARLNPYSVLPGR